MFEVSYIGTYGTLAMPPGGNGIFRCIKFVLAIFVEGYVFGRITFLLAIFVEGHLRIFPGKLG